MCPIELAISLNLFTFVLIYISQVFKIVKHSKKEFETTNKYTSDICNLGWKTNFSSRGYFVSYWKKKLRSMIIIRQFVVVGHFGPRVTTLISESQTKSIRSMEAQVAKLSKFSSKVKRDSWNANLWQKHPKIAKKINEKYEHAFTLSFSLKTVLKFLLFLIQHFNQST